MKITIDLSDDLVKDIFLYAIHNHTTPEAVINTACRYHLSTLSLFSPLSKSLLRIIKSCGFITEDRSDNNEKPL